MIRCYRVLEVGELNRTGPGLLKMMQVSEMSGENDNMLREVYM